MTKRPMPPSNNPDDDALADFIAMVSASSLSSAYWRKEWRSVRVGAAIRYCSRCGEVEMNPLAHGTAPTAHPFVPRRGE